MGVFLAGGLTFTVGVGDAFGEGLEGSAGRNSVERYTKVGLAPKSYFLGTLIWNRERSSSFGRC